MKKQHKNTKYNMIYTCHNSDVYPDKGNFSTFVHTVSKYLAAAKVSSTVPDL